MNKLAVLQLLHHWWLIEVTTAVWEGGCLSAQHHYNQIGLLRTHTYTQTHTVECAPTTVSKHTQRCKTFMKNIYSVRSLCMHGHTNKETHTHSSFSVKQATDKHAQTLNMWRLLQIFLNGSYSLLNLTVQLSLHTPFVSPNALVHFEITSLTLPWMLDSVPTRIYLMVDKQEIGVPVDLGAGTESG